MATFAIALAYEIYGVITSDPQLSTRLRAVVVVLLVTQFMMVGYICFKFGRALAGELCH
jgi:hypothetical protein